MKSFSKCKRSLLETRNLFNQCFIFTFRLFDRANDQSLVRRQDYLSLFSYAVRTQTGFQVAQNYFRANYTLIRGNRLTDAQMGTVAGYFARYINTEEQKADFQSFFANHPDTGVSVSSLNSALETIDKNIEWLKTNRQNVYEWFLSYKNQVNRSEL